MPPRVLLNIKTPSGHFVGCQFEPQWRDTLRNTIKEGDFVAVAGIVATYQDGRHLMLAESELQSAS